MKLTRLWAAAMLMTGALTADAQLNLPPETKNAALRYWQAFAEIKDPPADKATQELLEKTATGVAAWDEAKLGVILDANAEAIRFLERATKLPECDWGIEYSRGVQASIAFVPRARVLARLNTLAGMREMALGNSERAVNTWLVGLRFSQDVARGGTLIFALVGKSAMLSNLQALSLAVKNGQLDKAQKQAVYAAVRALPEDGFDWAAAWRNDGSGTELFAKQLATDPNAAGTFATWTGQPVTAFARPTREDLSKLERYVAAVDAVLKLPPAAAEAKLDALGSDFQALSPSYRNLIPSAKKVNQSRAEVVRVRLELLEELGGR